MQRRFPEPRPVVIDLFSGAGGMSLGFEQAGFDIMLGVDNDGYHVATHERNFPYGKAYCGSVVDLDGEKIRGLLRLAGEVDLIVGGPPCQGFSNMGLRDLRDPRNSLVDHFVRLVLELRPKAFVMENVPGMLAGATRLVLDKVIEAYEANGYNVSRSSPSCAPSGWHRDPRRHHPGARRWACGRRPSAQRPVQASSRPWAWLGWRRFWPWCSAWGLVGPEGTEGPQQPRRLQDHPGPGQGRRPGRTLRRLPYL